MWQFDNCFPISRFEVRGRGWRIEDIRCPSVSPSPAAWLYLWFWSCQNWSRKEWWKAVPGSGRNSSFSSHTRSYSMPSSFVVLSSSPMVLSSLFCLLILVCFSSFLPQITTQSYMVCALVGSSVASLYVIFSSMMIRACVLYFIYCNSIFLEITFLNLVSVFLLLMKLIPN